MKDSILLPLSFIIVLIIIHLIYFIYIYFGNCEKGGYHNWEEHEVDWGWYKGRLLSTIISIKCTKCNKKENIL